MTSSTENHNTPQESLREEEKANRPNSDKENKQANRKDEDQSDIPDRKLSLKDRLHRVKKTRWIRFAIISVIFFAWVILMGNPWLLLLWVLLIDIYITAYIPWGWWKKKTGATRTVMAWVDAIVYALVLIYFIFAFIGQQYEIPSSSLEKSLLVGDRLWVNKTIYGARVPQTPLHFPLAQHTIPWFNTKSYIENPQLDYHRMPGFRDIERGDIVVFNYPMGDTVVLKIQNPDYYQISYELKRNGIDDPKEYIKLNPDRFGELVWRPVDRRENYVKRTIGLPGERLRIVNDTIFINGKPIAEPDKVQYNYVVQVKAPVAMERWLDLGVRGEDVAQGPMHNDFTGTWLYDIPLTKDMKAELEKWSDVVAAPVRESETGIIDLGGVFPLEAPYNWTRNNMGEIWIPKRGSTLHLTPANYHLYERAIRTYEGNELEMRDGKIYINGKPDEYYTFKMDYYWMMGDNRDRSADSRYWGFVPEDHVVGSPLCILASFDQDRTLSSGKIRWNRIFANPNPDKSKW